MRKLPEAIKARLDGLGEIDGRTIVASLVDEKRGQTPLDLTNTDAIPLIDDSISALQRDAFDTYALDPHNPLAVAIYRSAFWRGVVIAWNSLDLEATTSEVGEGSVGNDYADMDDDSDE